MDSLSSSSNNSMKHSSNKSIKRLRGSKKFENKIKSTKFPNYKMKKMKLTKINYEINNPKNNEAKKEWENSLKLQEQEVFNYLHEELKVKYGYIMTIFQVLNSIGYFKRLIFLVPNEDLNNFEYTELLNIQRIFYELNDQTNLVNSKVDILLSKFEILHNEISKVHDSQEFLHYFLDYIMLKIKGTYMEKSFDNIFQGQILNHVFNKNGYEEAYRKYFYDLSLCVNVNSDNNNLKGM